MSTRQVTYDFRGKVAIVTGAAMSRTCSPKAERW